MELGASQGSNGAAILDRHGFSILKSISPGDLAGGSASLSGVNETEYGADDSGIYRTTRIVSPENRERILRAARRVARLHSGQLRESGEPYLVHPLQVAEILIDLRLDASAIVSALLHDVLEDTKMTRAELRRSSGRMSSNSSMGSRRSRL